MPALVTSVGDDRVLGLTLETGVDTLTLLGDHMMTFTIGTVKLAVTQGAIVGGPGTTDMILTVKAPASTAAVPLTSMIGPIVSVEPPLTVHTIIRTVHEGRKGFHQGHHQELVLGAQRLLKLAKLW